MHISKASGHATKWSGNKWAGVSCYPRLDVNSSAVILLRPTRAQKLNIVGLRLKSTLPLIDGDVCMKTHGNALCVLSSSKAFCLFPLNMLSQTCAQWLVKVSFGFRRLLMTKSEAKNGIFPSRWPTF